MMYTTAPHTNRISTPKPRFGFLPRRVTVDETQHVVLIKAGTVVGRLPTGRHWIRPSVDRLWATPATPHVLAVAGQEMLTSDGAAVRATVAAIVEVANPVAVFKMGGWHDRFYLATQLSLRNAVANMTLEDTLNHRASIDTALSADLGPVADQLGLTMTGIAVRDFVVPGELKRAVSEVVTARLSGQAALERARGESAALRSLGNAARAAADNPALLQLRLIQQMETSSGNTYVLGSAPSL